MISSLPISRRYYRLCTNLSRLLKIIILSRVLTTVDSQQLEENAPALDSRPGCEFNGVTYDVGSLVEGYATCMDRCECRVPAPAGGEPEISCPITRVCQNRLEECPPGVFVLWITCDCPYCYKGTLFSWVERSNLASGNKTMIHWLGPNSRSEESAARHTTSPTHHDAPPDFFFSIAHIHPYLYGFAEFKPLFAIDPFTMHTYTTSPSYYYQYHPVALATNRILVHIEADNDAHLAFSAEPRDLASMYEIVLGGWLNKYSVIRRCKQCRILAWATTIGILPNEPGQSFWVRFDDGVVAVGLTGFPSLFQFHDPDPLPVRYIGFATRLGSKGTFKVLDIDAIEHITDNLEPSSDTTGCSPIITVNDQTSPRLVSEPIVSLSNLFLYISADADVILSVSNDANSSSSESYRIVIGHGVGVRSSILQCDGNQCAEVFSAETFNVIGNDRSYGFWLDVGRSTEGAITFGREGHPAFLSYRYHKLTLFQDSFYIAFSVKPVGSADFRLCH